jgi:hypothetical protein
VANYVLNIAKGRFNELMRRVDNDDPAASVIVLVPLSVTDTEANRQDDDDLAAFLAAAPNEQTSGGWVRKVLTQADLSAPAPDDGNNRYPATLPQVTWTTPTTGNDVVALAICYDPDGTGAGTDSGVTVLAVCDFAVTADGNDVVLNQGDYARAA